MNLSRLIAHLPCLLAGVAFSTAAFGQATAPLTHERHKHHHNDKHAVIEQNAERFTTSRAGASLVLPTEEPMFTFVVFGDRTGGPNEGVDVLADAVAETNLLEPDLVMTVGDLIDGYNTTKDWMPQMKQFKQIMDELRCPWFPVAGNHDIYWRSETEKAPEGEHESAFEIHFGPLWYAFKHKDCWFIVLYSDEGDPKTGEKNFNKPDAQKMSDAQFNWLRETLSKAKDARHVFLFLHHPRWLGRNYGDDWNKVHKELVAAGNVSAVFGGHIHRMRYDPKDGIEYITLATVGAHQPGSSPAAGFLHQYHHITVRQNQIAMASIPVGQVMDVRQVTGAVSDMADALSKVKVVFAAPVKVNDDGSAQTQITFTLKNPVKNKVEMELIPQSKDSRWTFKPDHVHATLKPGESREFTFSINRPENSLDQAIRPVNLEVRMDLLTEKARFSIPTITAVVPGSVISSKALTATPKSE